MLRRCQRENKVLAACGGGRGEFGKLLLFPDKIRKFYCVFLGSFNRRKRNSLYVTVTLLIVSVLILTVGLAATTRTQNVTVGGYYPGVIVSIALLGRSRKCIAYKVLCNAVNAMKG